MRRRRFTRRRSTMRWFTPNLWNASNPQPYSNFTTAGGAGEQTSETAVANLLKGSAPFQGVPNASGLLAGTMLAERQYYNIKRIVGRMRWWLNADDDLPLGNSIVSVFWAIFRLNTDDQGQPMTDGSGALPRLAVNDNQDDKKLILAQDIWRTVIPSGTVLQAGQLLELDAEPPLYSMVDKTMRRSFRNEQDIYLATQVGVAFNTNPSDGITVTLRGLVNLRMLGTFGR